MHFIFKEARKKSVFIVTIMHQYTYDINEVRLSLDLVSMWQYNAVCHPFLRLRESSEMIPEQEERWLQEKMLKDVVYLAWIKVRIDNDFSKLWQS